MLPLGRDSYDRLDKYFVDVVRELLLGAPLVHQLPHTALHPLLHRRAAINRLVNYVSHQYVRRAVDEYKG